ncbi:hypothetical protein IW152_004171 [Coemansia sp. BCRC 34962]|nr:hypothetical protein IW152_004171 [Coemansia sp. BCRC 34962]
MQSPEDLFSELELRVLCPSCKLILCQPRTICPDQHVVCRICLDQLFQSPQPKCPSCHCDTLEPASTSISVVSEQLLECYYTIKQCRRSQASSTWREALQRTTSALSDCTVDTIEYPSSLVAAGLDSLLSSADLQMDSAKGGFSGSDDVLAGLPLSALSDSDDTDLDLPEPSSFLMQSPRSDKIIAKDRQRSSSRSPSHVPETPEHIDEPVVEPDTVATGPLVPEALNSQSEPGRKRKQPAVAKTSVADSNLTLLNESTDKAEPQAKRGRPRKSLAGTTESPAKSARSSAADTVIACDSAPHLRLLVTGLTEAQTTRLRRACKQAQSLGIASISIVSSPAELLRNAAQGVRKGVPPAFTHVVTSPNKDGRTARTFKYLVGLVSGAWVVKLEWLLECVKAKRMLAESEFAIVGDTAMPHITLWGPRPVGHLLDGYSVHVWSSDEKDKAAAHTLDELLDLIRVAGAKIKDECPTKAAEDESIDSDEANETAGLGNRAHGDKSANSLPAKYQGLFEVPIRKSKTIILVDKLSGARTTSFLDKVMEQTGSTFACRSKSWLFDCISANEVL